MTLDSLIILSGAFVALLPFLGFPNSWDRVLFALVGLFIVVLGIVVRRRSGVKTTPHRNSGFSDSPDMRGQADPQQVYRNEEHAAQ